MQVELKPEAAPCREQGEADGGDIMTAAQAATDSAPANVAAVPSPQPERIDAGEYAGMMRLFLQEAHLALQPRPGYKPRMREATNVLHAICALHDKLDADGAELMIRIEYAAEPPHEGGDRKQQTAPPEFEAHDGAGSNSERRESTTLPAPPPAGGETLEHPNEIRP